MYEEVHAASTFAQSAQTDAHRIGGIRLFVRVLRLRHCQMDLDNF
jgi:hypothetical protein